MNQLNNHKKVLITGSLFLGLILLLTTFLPGRAYSSSVIGIETYVDLPIGSSPGGLFYGPESSLWATGLESQAVYKVNHDLSLDEIPLSLTGGVAYDVSVGPDRNIWVSDQNLGSLYKVISTSDPQTEEYKLPDESMLDISQFVVGRDEAVWFTAYEGNQIGRFDRNGTYSFFELPQNTRPLGISNDQYGNIWFTAWGSYQIGKISLAGELTLINLQSRLYRPTEMIRDDQGFLWFVYDIGTRVSRINPLTQTVEHFPITTTSNAFMDLNIGPDGNIWLLGTSGVGYFEPAVDGPMNYQEIPYDLPVFEGSGRSQITSGGDGYMYFTRLDRDKIYRLNTQATLLHDLQINIKRMTAYVLAGGPFYTTVEVTNWSDQDAENAAITIQLDENIQFRTITGINTEDCVLGTGEVTCLIGTIPANSTMIYQVNFDADKPALTEKERTLVFTIDLSGGDYFPENNQVERTFDLLNKFDYFNDFSESAEEDLWSHTQLFQPDSGFSYLGSFDNDNVTLLFETLPMHDRVKSCFQLFVNGGWDGDQFINPENPESVIGPDLWAHYMDENAIVVSTFSNQPVYSQSFPDPYQQGTHPAQQGARQIGDFDGDGLLNDARYDFCFTKIHTAEELKLTFYGVNLTGQTGEKWGVDDVHVEIYYHDAFHWIYLPVVLQ